MVCLTRILFWRAAALHLPSITYIHTYVQKKHDIPAYLPRAQLTRFSSSHVPVVGIGRFVWCREEEANNVGKGSFQLSCRWELAAGDRFRPPPHDLFGNLLNTLCRAASNPVGRRMYALNEGTGLLIGSLRAFGYMYAIQPLHKANPYIIGVRARAKLLLLYLACRL